MKPTDTIVNLPVSRSSSAKTANPSAEGAIIAALVNCGDSDVICRYALDHSLDVDCFTIQAFANAYSTILDLASAGIPVDIPILAQHLDQPALVAVDSACREHVSRANFSLYASSLHAAKRNRAAQAARDHLARATSAGVGVSELRPLFDDLSRKDDGNFDVVPPFKPFTDAELSVAPLHPKCIVEHYLYADLALISAAGGIGKTTMAIYEAVRIALGFDVWGCRVRNPGKTLFITAEDPRDLFAARLREAFDAMQLTDYQRRFARESVAVWDVSDNLLRLAELDSSGNVRLTNLADQIVYAYRDAALVQVVFDPAISFGPGERIINDGEQAVVVACRRIIRGLGCCVRLIHHSGKANARTGAMDQYASRGGTALPDGCRMVTTLAAVDSANSAAIPPAGFDLQPGESGFILKRAKLSYAPEQPTIWIRRRGYNFDHFIEGRRSEDETRELDARKIAEFIADELHHGRKYTMTTLEQCGKLKIPRTRLRAALAILETNGQLVERQLPPSEQRGVRKNYLHVHLANVDSIPPTPPAE